MSPALDRLRTEVALLDESERAQLALELLQSLDGDSPESLEEVEAAWNEEAAHRVAQFDRGEMATMSAEDVHSDKPLPSGA